MHSPLFILTVLAPLAACKPPTWPPPLETTIIYEYVTEPVTSGTRAHFSLLWCPVSTHTATVTKLCSIVPHPTHVPAHTSMPASPKSVSVSRTLEVSNVLRPAAIPTSAVPFGSTRRPATHKPTASSKNATVHSIPRAATAPSLHAHAPSSSHARVSSSLHTHKPSSSHVRLSSAVHPGFSTSTKGNLTWASPVSTAMATRYRVPVYGFNATAANATMINATVATIRHNASGLFILTANATTVNMVVPTTRSLKLVTPPTTKLAAAGSVSKPHSTVGESGGSIHTSHTQTSSKAASRPSPQATITRWVPPRVFPWSLPTANSRTKSLSRTEKLPAVLPSHTSSGPSSLGSDAGMSRKWSSSTRAPEESRTGQAKMTSEAATLSVSIHSDSLDPAAESRAWSILEEALRELSSRSHMTHHTKILMNEAPVSTSAKDTGTKASSMHAHPTSRVATDG